MKLYRFSPIKTKEEMFEALKYIHLEGFRLCKKSIGHYLPVAGNIGIFCHYDDEYEFLLNVSEEITDHKDAFNGKYFRLLKPVVVPAQGDIPEITYKYLYIRKPDPYRSHVGDLDFDMSPEEYKGLKASILEIKGARIFERPTEDMVELYDPDVDVLAYIRIV